MKNSFTQHPENFYDDYSDLSIIERGCIRTWKWNFYNEKNVIRSQFDVEHYRITT